MGKIYATREDTGAKFVAFYRCDRCGFESDVHWTRRWKLDTPKSTERGRPTVDYCGCCVDEMICRQCDGKGVVGKVILARHARLEYTTRTERTKCPACDGRGILP